MQMKTIANETMTICLMENHDLFYEQQASMIGIAGIDA